MKRIYFISLSLFITSLILAQAPQAFKYQAIARDEAGSILSNWDIGLQVSIIQGGDAGEEVYVESHQVKSNIYGLINLFIGEGEVSKGDFTTIDWSKSSYYIKMEMDTRGGTEYKDLGTSQLYAVPYALYAEKAGDLVEQKTQQATKTQNPPNIKVIPSAGSRNGTPNSKFPSEGNSHMNVNSGKVGVGTTDPQEKLDVNGNIKMNLLIMTDEKDNQWVLGVDTTGALQVISIFTDCGDSLYDYRNGQYYQTIMIDTQCWMEENINIGTIINGITNQTDNGTIEKYCNNNSESECDIYGGTYQWDEAMQYITTEGAQGICPNGWHIPTDGEWTTLRNYLGVSLAGGKLKSTGTIQAGTGLWNEPNEGATNESGFTALPGPIRFSGGSFSDPGNQANFWSSTEYDATRAFIHWLSYDSTTLYRLATFKSAGRSVRCLNNE